MFDEPSQRQFRRYQIQLPLLHKSSSSRAKRVQVGWTRDMGEGGICVELDRSLPISTNLQVRLQTDRGVIHAEAAVVWSGPRQGRQGGILHGLAFTRLAPEQRESFQYLLLSWGLGRRAGGVRIPFRVAVTCQFRGELGPLIVGYGHDGSRNGLLLRLPQVVPPNSTLDLTLHTDQGSVTLEAVVIWVAPPEGRSPGGPIRHGLRLGALRWPTALALGRALVGPLTDTPWLARREGSA